MAKSIISNLRRCYVCGNTIGIHKHHIYGGANRQISEREGCWVYLCGPHHNLSSAGIHFDPKFNLEMKEMCQNIWMEKNGKTPEDFRALFGKSYV